MGLYERARSRSEQLVGSVKEMLGQASGSRRTRASGLRDRVVGGIRETTNEVRDWAATAARDARRRLGNRSPRHR
jgi:uncharacterized protein YjbJ (UPF0337 family)